jgi:hypothetical protein
LRILARRQARFLRRLRHAAHLRGVRIADEVHVTAGTLDDPASAPPTLYVWWEGRLLRLHADDGLPKSAKQARGADPVA